MMGAEWPWSFQGEDGAKLIEAWPWAAGHGPFFWLQIYLSLFVVRGPLVGQLRFREHVLCDGSRQEPRIIVQLLC